MSEEAGPWRGASTRVINAVGGLVLPGLVDAHGHLVNLGRMLATLNLGGTRSKDEVVWMVAVAQQRAAGRRWIRGRGWDQNDWPVKAFPTWRDLEGTGDNPVYLKRIGGHAVWVNRTAMDLCHITRHTADPPGGRIVRDARGEPTGIFIDRATELIAAHIPAPSDDQLDAWLGAAIAHCNCFGLVGVHDAGTSAREIHSLERLARAHPLPLHIYAMLDSDDSTLVNTWFARVPGTVAGGRVSVHAVKVYADGALGSRGAALLQPYTDDPRNSGLLVNSPAYIDRLARRAYAAGFQCCTHAIGDRANRIVLDAYEHALDHRGTDRRFRIEHCQVLTRNDLPRFARLGVIASMQPTHATSDMYWAADRVGKARLAGAYAWRSLLDSGARLAFGSDFPVESVDPVRGIYAAVTREDERGWPPGGWRSAQKLTLREAIDAFTRGAAYASFSEQQTGMLRAGMRADITVLDRNLFAIPAHEILKAHAVATIVAGDVVWRMMPRR